MHIQYDPRARDVQIAQCLRDVAREATLHHKAQRIARARDAITGCVVFVLMFAIAFQVIA